MTEDLPLPRGSQPRGAANLPHGALQCSGWIKEDSLFLLSSLKTHLKHLQLQGRAKPHCCPSRKQQQAEAPAEPPSQTQPHTKATCHNPPTGTHPSPMEKSCSKWIHHFLYIPNELLLIYTELASQPAMHAAEPPLALLLKHLTWTWLDDELQLWGGRRRAHGLVGRGSSWQWTLGEAPQHKANVMERWPR